MTYAYGTGFIVSLFVEIHVSLLLASLSITRRMKTLTVTMRLDHNECISAFFEWVDVEYKPITCINFSDYNLV
jgi:hypothetical protein